MIYRGQKYGDPVGRWWTSSRSEAVKFAMSRGGNRTWVVLALDEDDMTWLNENRTYERAGDDKGDWYDIPLETLKARWTGVSIVEGAIDLSMRPADHTDCDHAPCPYEKEYRLFWVDPDNDERHFLGAGFYHNEKDAAEGLREEFWDDRLDTTGCMPLIILKESE